jgi:hypothetical protein
MQAAERFIAQNLHVYSCAHAQLLSTPKIVCVHTHECGVNCEL